MSGGFGDTAAFARALTLVQHAYDGLVPVLRPLAERPGEVRLLTAMRQHDDAVVRTFLAKRLLQQLEDLLEDLAPFSEEATR